jgi:alpha-L-rhamnosidase
MDNVGRPPPSRPGQRHYLRCAPLERWNPLVDAMTDSDRLVVRSRVGSETGGYDPERFAQQMRGLPPIDWDTEREMVIAEPFFSYAEHEAVVRAGPRRAFD